jgi:hypothetical protein
VLAKGLVDELGRRDIHADSEPTDHVALISEWDTLYGRTLPAVVKCKLIKKEPPCDPNPSDDRTLRIHNFTYLNGLDGLLPRDNSQETAKQDKSVQPEKQRGATDFFKVETDTESLERPIGQSQFDYLRRISIEIHEIDRGLRKNGEKIKAIGILGGDVFDKLLILRALRPEFPEALFFTTDFDEAYTIKSELPYTRNLIISSSFGPNLGSWLQGEIPYFRDTYETSAFLATQLAVGYRHDNFFKSLQKKDYPSSNISDQLRSPRLFEVKRNGEILSFAWEPPAPAANVPARVPNDPEPKEEKIVGLFVRRAVASGFPCLDSNSNIPCGNIQPGDADELARHRSPTERKPVEKPFPTFVGKGGISLAVMFFAGAVVAVLAFWKNWVPNWRLEFGFVAFSCVVASAACFYWVPLARWLTDDGNGEPITLLDGTSLWPTVLLRILSSILAVYFIFKTMIELDGNLHEIAIDMGLKPRPMPLPKQLAGFKNDLVATWRKFVDLFVPSRRKNSRLRTVPIFADWRAYVRRERIWRRNTRAAAATIIMFLIVSLIFIPNIGIPFFASRSSRAHSWYNWSAGVDWLLMLFLIFIVFDATCSCLLFVKKLSLAKKSGPWPAAT